MVRIIVCHSLEELCNVIKWTQETGRKIMVSSQTKYQNSDIARSRTNTKNAINVVVAMKRIHHILDGVIEVDAGCSWVDIVRHIHPLGYTIKSCQSGLTFSIGGSICGNIHGRKTHCPMLIDTVESLDFVDSNGQLHRVTKHDAHFQAFFGSLGLLGIITRARLRLMQDLMVVKVNRVLKPLDVVPFTRYALANTNIVMLNMQIGTDSVLCQYHYHDTSNKGQTTKNPLQGVSDSNIFTIAWFTVVVIFLLIVRSIGYIDTFELEKRNFLNDRSVGVPRSINNNYDVWCRPYIPNFKILELFFPLHDYDYSYATLLSIFKAHTSLVSYGSRVIWQDHRSRMHFMSFSEDATREQPWLSMVINCVASPTAQRRVARAIHEKILSTGHRLTYHTTYLWEFDRHIVHIMFPNINNFNTFKNQLDPKSVFTNEFYIRYIK